MARPALKSLIAAAAGVTALVVAVEASPVEAAILNYAFEVTIDQGPYAGGIYRGNFKFDDSKLVRCSSASPRLCATPAQSALTLSFTFLNQTYNEQSDADYFTSGQSFPAVYYYPERENTTLSPYVLSLIVLPPTSPISFSILGDFFFMGFLGIGDADDPTKKAGKVSYTLLPDKPPGETPCERDPASCEGEAVPEPSEIAGSAVALGLMGLFWRSRRRKQATLTRSELKSHTG
ncbi:MAG: PEP-CTERM sorting domain-containing protein [Oscillatoriales cyanobacterium C42_A2020_001]|nr:PEP-CTERM sorting domain-containing protein [Leptolyngbyaceae cyanobacterium C42_A2020_001]